MNQDAKNNLAPPDAENKDPSKRKMTAAIIEEDKQKKDVYEFLEDDDDFEEFEQDNYDDVDVEIPEESDKKLW